MVFADAPGMYVVKIVSFILLILFSLFCFIESFYNTMINIDKCVLFPLINYVIKYSNMVIKTDITFDAS